LFPCDLLFVHRDAERDDRGVRVAEIRGACSSLSEPPTCPVVCVIPVRMTEAWLLHDEDAIKAAADNPRCKRRLPLPAPQAVEAIPDPQNVLHELLKGASELSPRRLKDFRYGQRVHRVAQYTADQKGFGALRRLTAFQALEAELAVAVSALRGDTP
jgi:hypothetical protein